MRPLMMIRSPIRALMISAPPEEYQPAPNAPWSGAFGLLVVASQRKVIDWAQLLNHCAASMGSGERLEQGG